MAPKTKKQMNPAEQRVASRAQRALDEDAMDAMGGTNTGSLGPKKKEAGISNSPERIAEHKNAKLKKVRDALAKKAQKKAREAEEDANDPTLKRFPDLQRKR